MDVTVTRSPGTGSFDADTSERAVLLRGRANVWEDAAMEHASSLELPQGDPLLLTAEDVLDALAARGLALPAKLSALASIEVHDDGR